jgi:hypothetical protein
LKKRARYAQQKKPSCACRRAPPLSGLAVEIKRR